MKRFGRHLRLGVRGVEGYSISVSCVGNIGPALGTLGPAYSWSALPASAKWLSTLLMLIGRLIGGVLGGKVSSRAMIMAVSAAAIVFLLFGMFLPETLVIGMLGAQVPVSILFIVLCGLCTSVMWGAIFNLAVEGLGKYTSIASGLFMVMVCGGGIVPLVQGTTCSRIL